MEEIRFESLDYGAYALEYPIGYEFSENVKYSTAEFDKLHVRKVRLPVGQNNLIYLLSDTFDGCIKMLSSNNFLVPATYKRVYFPRYYIGRFMQRRYNLSLGKNDLNYRTKAITDRTKYNVYGGRKIIGGHENLFFVLGDLYALAKPIMDAFTIKRNYTEFYPEFMRLIKELSPNIEPLKKAECDHRIIIIDAATFKFKPGADLKANKSNPLFLLYLAYLRNKDISNLNIDIDMMICSGNMFLKFNPSKLTMDKWDVFRRALFRIIGTNMDDYTDSLSEKDKAEIQETAKDRIITNTVANRLAPFTNNISGSTKAVLQNAVENKVRKEIIKKETINKEIKAATKEISAKIDDVKPNEFQKAIDSSDNIAHGVNQNHLNKLKSFDLGYEPLSKRTGITIDDDDDEDFDIGYDRPEDSIDDEINDAIEDPEVAEEVLDDIQERIAPMKNPEKAQVNSARDAKLREQQKKVVVGTETIEEILSRDTNNVPIEEGDKSRVLHTSNQNMHKVKFANFDKTYIDELYMKDIVACFDFLKDKESPFFVTSVDVRDTSDSQNLKNTWTVVLKDETGKRHTVKVDIPKFQDNRFMLLGGNRYVILKQNFYNPLVKDTPDTVILTTNYNKITITRKATKSLTSIERIFSLVKKTGDSKMFVSGDSSPGNRKYISTLEYDELSRRLFKFESKNCEIVFSRDYIRDNYEDKIPNNIKDNEFYIGHEGDNPIIINEDTGMDKFGRTIAEIIEAHLPDDYRKIYNSIKGPKQSMYAECKMAGIWVPVIVPLIVWDGLAKTLDTMGMKWTFHTNLKRVPTPTSSSSYIRFADGVLEYERKTYTELMMNGLLKLKPESFMFNDFEDESGYGDYIRAQWGSYKGINELKNFKEFLIDPITLQVCKDMSLPSDAAGLIIHAVKLLSDNTYVSKASDKSYRVRSIEMIPSILYGCLAKQYKAYVNTGGRIPMTLKQNAVISALQAEKTVEAYSTLNPVVEVSKTYNISTKGYKGSNSTYSYDEEKRSYDPSAVGKLAITTSADANVGISRNLVVEPTILNARGYREEIDDIENLKDVNIFSPAEMLTPGTARCDDPIRTAIATKQSSHIVPVNDAVPALISNGYDEVVQFTLSDDFVVNAEEDGKVVEVDEETGFIVVQYKSGKFKAINTKPEIVKNSGSAFYLSNALTPTHTKVGEKFHKDEVLAYHPKYFNYSELNGLRFSIGPLVKMAIVSSYNTYEDAGICTQTLADRMTTSIVYMEEGKFKKNNEIFSMVNIGDHVNIGDSLIKFGVSVEEDELSKYLSNLNEENAELLKEESQSDIKTHHAGKVIDIKVYTLQDPKNLSPSLGNIVQKYFDRGNNKKSFLNKYDSTSETYKAGYLLTDSTQPIKNRYNQIKGHKGIDVLIEIYIEHDDVVGVGDKVALYGPNKQIISEIIPKGYEPYSEFRPDEEISIFTSPGTISRRMTSSIIAISSAFKCMVELKRVIKDRIKYK